MSMTRKYHTMLYSWQQLFHNALTARNNNVYFQEKQELTVFL